MREIVLCVWGLEYLRFVIDEREIVLCVWGLKYLRFVIDDRI